MFAIAGAVILGVLALVIALAIMEPADRASLAFEAGKASIALLTGALFTVVVAELVRQRDQRRADDQSREDARLAFRGELVEAYSRAKGIRRALRARGLAPRGEWELSEEQLQAFDQGLADLSKAQLAIERIARHPLPPRWQFTQSAAIVAKLSAVESYLNRTVKEWERGRSTLHVGSNVARVGEWPSLAAFLADADDGGDFDIAVGPVHEILELVDAELVGQRA